jgi:hypothetical protein
MSKKEHSKSGADHEQQGEQALTIKQRCYFSCPAWICLSQDTWKCTHSQVLTVYAVCSQCLLPNTEAEKPRKMTPAGLAEAGEIAGLLDGMAHHASPILPDAWRQWRLLPVQASSQQVLK